MVSDNSLWLQVLGPLRLRRDGVEVHPGPRQQAYLLALLLARAGQPVSAGELIDLIWDDDAPASAVNVVHKYVGALRRIFEPTLPAREAGSYLHRHGNGYRLTIAHGMLDLIDFREHVETARTHLAHDDNEGALDHYTKALGLWHGPAGHGLTYGSAAMIIFTALDGEFFDACTAAADLAISLGQPHRVLPPLRLATSMAPLHESVQASLITTLAAAGQQAEALAAFRTVRARLAEDLGIDPGPVLHAAHQRVLRPTLAPVAGVPETPPIGGLVGRVEELAVFHQAVASVTGLVIVEGEPGVGKTRLLEEAAAEADRRGALVGWGRCLDGDDTPSMWPWVQAIGAVLDNLPTAREKWLGGELSRLIDPRENGPALPDNATRFRLFERVVTVIGEASAQRPVLLVIDDLQWADFASLRLFGHLAARMPHGTVLVGALRNRAPALSTELSGMLATASRVPSHRRIRLGPLDAAEAAELVRHEIGREPSPDAARIIHARTAGNPFFVRELSRLLTGVLTEDTARTGVPSTVHDIVRDRMAGLGHDSRNLLQIAAFIGREVDLDLLARAADLDIETCLDRIEALDALGLLEPTPDDPFSFRFAHDLVREAVSETTPPPRATRLHMRIADALEHTGSTAERLAYHLWAAGPLTDPARRSR
ncbi:DNA-binding SARP family transcriptional activator [Kibdelosporangium banguiense]|uniref:DNA-binding SARP family transcriptional activator n=1 Tax=Kibdelosporangium banguiense TaxID=1365924 RepID=A0ABS4TWM7_9PSEU|nr:BTAD domain-containing putative transcriptional regulator [Kibdelosporangium banguiense]MBP2328814.1 DNA-binding SARP family transcriptional activator [Kibdelosporangium banguiense]